MFGSKKPSMSEVYRDATVKVLDVINLKKSDANKLKTTAYLLMAMIACLEAISKGKSRPFIDNMVKDVDALVKDYKMRVSELATDETELEKILAFFDDEHGVDGDTTVNGYAAFAAIYEQFTKDVVVDIYEHRGDGNGSNVFPYASKVILEALRGKGKGSQNFIEVSMIVTQMMGDVIKAFR